MKNIIAAMALGLFFATAGYAQVVPAPPATTEGVYLANVTCGENGTALAEITTIGKPIVEGPGTFLLPSKEGPVIVQGKMEMFLSDPPEYNYIITITFPWPEDLPSGLRTCILAVGNSLAPAGMMIPAPKEQSVPEEDKFNFDPDNQKVKFN